MSAREKSTFDSELYFSWGKWGIDKKFSSDFIHSPFNGDILKNSNSVAVLTIEPKFLLYGLAGPYAQFKGAANFQGSDKKWFFTDEFQTVLGFDASVISKKIQDINTIVFRTGKILAQGNFETPKNLAKKQETKSQQTNSAEKQNPAATPQVPNTIKDYFLKGKELEGLEIIKNYDPRNYSQSWFYIPPSRDNENPIIKFPIDLPYIFNPRQMAKYSIEQPYMEKVKEMGFSVYSLAGGGKEWIDQLVARFGNQRDEWYFLESNKIDSAILILDKNTSSILVPQDSSQPEYKIRLVNLIYNYQKRIGGEVYELRNNDWNTINLNDLEQAFKSANK
jgi:hypothetical protein